MTMKKTFKKTFVSLFFFLLISAVHAAPMPTQATQVLTPSSSAQLIQAGMNTVSTNTNASENNSMSLWHRISKHINTAVSVILPLVGIVASTYALKKASQGNNMLSLFLVSAIPLPIHLASSITYHINGAKSQYKSNLKTELIFNTVFVLSTAAHIVFYNEIKHIFK
jgi:predicted transporter